MTRTTMTRPFPSSALYVSVRNVIAENCGERCSILWLSADNSPVVTIGHCLCFCFRPQKLWEMTPEICGEPRASMFFLISFFSPPSSRMLTIKCETKDHWRKTKGKRMRIKMQISGSKIGEWKEKIGEWKEKIHSFFIRTQFIRTPGWDLLKN